MFTPYVQDVSKWINYYSNHGTSIRNGSVSDQGLLPTDTVGLAQESNMSVAKVEPQGPPPPAPHTGPSLSLHSITPSHESVVQASYTAKRLSLEKTHLNGKTRRPVNPAKNNKKKKNNNNNNPHHKVGGNSKGQKGKKKLSLYGTPEDIFKSKTGSKTKKNK